MFRASWFAKYFSTRVVAALNRLRSKARRRFRDRLLTVLPAHGLGRLRCLLFGHAGRGSLTRLVQFFSALVGAIARWAIATQEGSPGRRTVADYYAKLLRVECLESRSMLTTLTWAGTTGQQWTMDANIKDWTDNGVDRLPWTNNSDAVLPANLAGTVAMADLSIGPTLIYANSITIQGGSYSFVAAGAGDELEISPTSGPTGTLMGSRNRDAASSFQMSILAASPFRPQLRPRFDPVDP